VAGRGAELFFLCSLKRGDAPLCFYSRYLICLVCKLGRASCLLKLCHDGVPYTIKGDVGHLHTVSVHLRDGVPLLGNCF
jgi:hypothetical protein